MLDFLLSLTFGLVHEEVDKHKTYCSYDAVEDEDVADVVVLWSFDSFDDRWNGGTDNKTNQPVQATS